MVRGVGGVTVSMVAFQAVDPGSIPGRRISWTLWGGGRERCAVDRPSLLPSHDRCMYVCMHACRPMYVCMCVGIIQEIMENEVKTDNTNVYKII